MKNEKLILATIKAACTNVLLAYEVRDAINESSPIKKEKSESDILLIEKNKQILLEIESESPNLEKVLALIDECHRIDYNSKLPKRVDFKKGGIVTG